MSGVVVLPEGEPIAVPTHYYERDFTHEQFLKLAAVLSSSEDPFIQDVKRDLEEVAELLKRYGRCASGLKGLK